jgi:HD-like signal output (HDOD) protein
VFFTTMKKRILFVEDDPLQLQMYGMMLEDERNRWEVVTVDDGPQALRLMEQSPFDVIVADWLMPGLDGAELMKEVRTRFPRSSRIILSVLGDQEKVARCLNDIHQFIPKPFDVKVLKTTLSRICGLDACLQDDKLKALIGQLGTLPSFPTLYVEVMKETACRDSSIESIAAIIAKDPGMTAKMLQIVNSAVIALAHRVSSPFEAVEYLGLGTVRSLVLSAHIFSCLGQTNLKGFSVNQLWNHSVGTGALARRIMQLEGAEAADADDAYTAGMLHDVGKLMLANSLPEQFQQALTLAAERQVPLHEAEAEVFGATHAGAAAYLLGLWGLPAPLVEAVAFHHTPRKSERPDFSPLTAVHLANVFEQEISGTKSGGRRSAIDVDCPGIAGRPDRVEIWRAEAVNLVGAHRKH